MNNDLNKACDLAKSCITEIVKSQHDHHVGYTRTSQSGAVSNVAQKGTASPDRRVDLYRHVRGELAHVDYSDKDKARRHLTDIANKIESAAYEMGDHDKAVFQQAASHIDTARRTLFDGGDGEPHAEKARRLLFDHQ